MGTLWRSCSLPPGVATRLFSSYLYNVHSCCERRQRPGQLHAAGPPAMLPRTVENFFTESLAQTPRLPLVGLWIITLDVEDGRHTVEAANREHHVIDHLSNQRTHVTSSSSDVTQVRYGLHCMHNILRFVGHCS